MSQRSEKYARSMERRVARLEERVEKIGFDVTAQGVRVTTSAELLEAMAMPQYVANADWEPSRRAGEVRRLERQWARRKRATRRRVYAVCVAAMAIILLVIFAVRATAEQPEVDAPEAAPVAAITPEVIAALEEPWDGEGEDPLEAEKIEAALLAQGYFSDAVPLPYDLQDIMRTACEAYGCPYPLALAVAETESRFDLDAVGAVGEIGLMQLNPGPGGAYHAELADATGQDPATPAGNIICGVYLLGKYMGSYADPARAAMAYNLGEAGAKKAWAAGITSTDYSAEVLEAMERWEHTVDAWAGI